MRGRASTLLLAGSVLLATGATAGAGAFPGKNGLVAFASLTASGKGRVWTTKPSGVDSRRVTEVPGGRPAWSPNGQLIAFVGAIFPDQPYSTYLGTIFVVRSDGTGLRKVGNGSDPAWSPDGKRIVTTSGEAETFVDIIDVADGRTVRVDKLTDYGIGYETYLQPAWSPDGRRIAFTTSAGIALYDVARGRIVVPRLNDSSALARGDSNLADPSWSPDGKRLAFDTKGLGGDLKKGSSVFVARLDGTHLRRLARNASQPVWSPDGRKVVFVRLMTRSNTELFVMNADGTNQKRLTFRAGLDTDPDWQPLAPSR